MRALPWLLLAAAFAVVPARRAAAQTLELEVIARYPHDPTAFTQGLLLHDGALYESTGLVGRSSLRRVDLHTGDVERRTDLDPSLFGEGLARVGDRLIQLTWRDGVALVYDLEQLQPIGSFPYEGEGWGLCHDGRQLVMSDGSARLQLRDPDSFELLDSVAVSRDGSPIDGLNELECVGDEVYANVLGSDEILRIDRASGRVRATIDASRLLDPAEAEAADVLNGIAHDPQSGHLLLTGKLWPALFEVRIRERGDDEPSGAGGCTVAPPRAGHPARPNALCMLAAGLAVRRRLLRQRRASKRGLRPETGLSTAPPAVPDQPRERS